MKLLKKGKVKDIYEVDEKRLLFIFSDRISAYDVMMNDPIPHKGEILCKFAKFWFQSLPITNHMIQTREPNMMIVKKLNMIPIECVVRGYLYGSLYERYKKDKTIVKDIDGKQMLKAEKLPVAVFDPTTKSDLHDIPINKDKVLEKGIVSEHDYNFLETTSIKLYNYMYSIADRAGFILADVKFEFGIDNESGEIILADSLGPDEFRLWHKSSYKIGSEQDSYDKQILRDWLYSIGFKQHIMECADKHVKPNPPHIPQKLIEKIYGRYREAYDSLCR